AAAGPGAGRPALERCRHAGPGGLSGAAAGAGPAAGAGDVSAGGCDCTRASAACAETRPDATPTVYGTVLAVAQRHGCSAVSRRALWSVGMPHRVRPGSALAHGRPSAVPGDGGG